MPLTRNWSRSLIYHFSDKATSFYVGDAAGRPNDFASTDRKFALNVELPFHTPEVSDKEFGPSLRNRSHSRLIFSIFPRLRTNYQASMYRHLNQVCP